MKKLLAASVLVAGLGMVAMAANATTISGSVGGAPTNADFYENFDSCATGASACTTASGIVVSFSPQAQVVNGSSNSKYAAPFLSGNNGNNFGNGGVPQANGQDTTNYITSGANGSSGTPGASATLTFLGQERYMGLLWGSVDTYNTLTFYNGTTLVGTFTGADVTAAANGNQGEQGTFYVNINLSDSFDRVVATSSEFAFEFDNVAFSAHNISVPEPGTAGMFLLGLLLLGSGYWFKGRRLA